MAETGHINTKAHARRRNMKRVCPFAMAKQTFCHGVLDGPDVEKTQQRDISPGRPTPAGAEVPAEVLSDQQRPLGKEAEQNSVGAEILHEHSDASLGQAWTSLEVARGRSLDVNQLLPLLIVESKWLGAILSRGRKKNKGFRSHNSQTSLEMIGSSSGDESRTSRRLNTWTLLDQWWQRMPRDGLGLPPCGVGQDQMKIRTLRLDGQSPTLVLWLHTTIIRPVKRRARSALHPSRARGVRDASCTKPGTKASRG